MVVRSHLDLTPDGCALLSQDSTDQRFPLHARNAIRIGCREALHGNEVRDDLDGARHRIGAIREAQIDLPSRPGRPRPCFYSRGPAVVLPPWCSFVVQVE